MVDSLGLWIDFVGDEYKVFFGIVVYMIIINKVFVVDVIKLDFGFVVENVFVYLNGDYIGIVIDFFY